MSIIAIFSDRIRILWLKVVCIYGHKVYTLYTGLLVQRILIICGEAISKAPVIADWD